MKNKEYILFDLDGTLTDPAEGITNSVEYSLKKYGIKVEIDTVPQETYVQEIAGKIAEKIGMELEISVEDEGIGIENIERAMQPLFTTDTDGERSGMGFTVMQTFMDDLTVKSKYGEGTKVIMRKKLSQV